MLAQTLDWIAAHPVVTGAALVVSLALALIYGAIIYVAIGRMSPDYFVRDETSSSAWRQRYPLAGCDCLVAQERVRGSSGVDGSCDAGFAGPRGIDASHRYRPARFSRQAQVRERELFEPRRFTRPWMRFAGAPASRRWCCRTEGKRVQILE